MNRKKVREEILKMATYLTTHADEIALKDEDKYNLTFLKISINFDEESIAHIEIDKDEFENKYCLEGQRTVKPKMKDKRLEEIFKKQLAFFKNYR